VAVHSDGFIEVFGSDIDVRVVDVPHGGSARCERLAEQWIETTLPPRHRSVYFPGNVRAQHMPRVITPREIADTLLELALIRSINTLTALSKGEVASCTL